MKIGILGGTFDPIHKGHIYLAQKALKKLSLDKIIFIPAYLPPHKKNIAVTAPQHRYRMVKLATAGNRKFKVSDIEIKRKGRSYSVETLRHLRKRFGDRAEIFFITGSDSLKDLHKWRNLKGILILCRFVVVKRPRFSIKRVPRDFIILNIDAKDITSTEIRKRIKKGSSIGKKVPVKVRDYIIRHNLYV